MERNVLRQTKKHFAGVSEKVLFIVRLSDETVTRRL